jgi:FkbM family methyltransferase
MVGTLRTRLKRDVEGALRTLLPEPLKVPLRRLRFAIGERSFRPYTQTLTVGGISFEFFVGDVIGQRWYGGPATRSLNPEDDFIRRMLQPGDTAFDCGAHHGMTTILLANWVGETGKVIAFEASPHNAAILRKNIELNHLSQARCENTAIAAQPGVVRMTEESNTRVTPSQHLGKKVEAVQLDQYLDEKPTFVKIDIEGFEVEALKGAQRVLALRPKFVIEVHTKTLANFNTNVEELLSLIDLDAYDVWIQWDDNEAPVPYQKNDRITDRVHLFGLPKTS